MKHLLAHYNQKMRNFLKTKAKLFNDGYHAGLKAVKIDATKDKSGHRKKPVYDKKLLAIAQFIHRTCFVYYADTSSDDPSLTPKGQHPSAPVNDLNTFKKYFKIEPKSGLSYVKKLQNNKK